jgi:hypothetical protein
MKYPARLTFLEVVSQIILVKYPNHKTSRYAMDPIFKYPHWLHFNEIAVHFLPS